MEKSNYDFVPIKQKILLEARRLVETCHIDTRHRCIRDLCELEAYVHRLKPTPAMTMISLPCIRASIPANSGNGDTAASVSTVQWKKNLSRII